MMKLKKMPSGNSEEEDGEFSSDTEMAEPVHSMPYRWQFLTKKVIMANPPTCPNAAFMRAIIRKDVIKVTEDLAHDPMLYCYTDDQGVSAIEQAVKSGSVDMLQVFLHKSTKAQKATFIEHALLYAIQEDKIKIVEFLLDARGIFWNPNGRRNNSKEDDSILPETLNQDKSTNKRKMKKHKKSTNLKKFKIWADKKNSVYIPGFENSGYSPYITPIILAAKLNRLEIITILLQRNLSEIHPLTMECHLEDCEICLERKIFKRRRDLEDSNRQLEIYRALSSPAYIFLSGVTDPIDEAFELSWEMTRMLDEDPSFRLQYGEIAESCQTFAWEMLDLCRTTREVDTFLTRDESEHHLNTEWGNTCFPRMVAAIHFKQKEFIAHPYCQQTLDKDWYSGLPDWVCNSEVNHWMFILYVLLWVPMWPVVCLVSMLKPSLISIGRLSLKHPINKFITDTLSFLTFITLLFVNDVFYKMEGKHLAAGSGFSIVEYLLIMWIIGMSGRHIKMLCHYRIILKHIRTNFFKSSVLWQITTFSLLAFWLWIITRVIGIILAYTVWQPDALRSDWHQTHPILISEAFFSFGTILSFVRLTELFKASSILGPIQITLTKMLTDIVRFLFIYLVIITGFVVAITKVYSSYENNRRIVEGDYKEQGEGYIGFQQTYKTLFWNVFGYGELNVDADIVVDYNETDAIANLIIKNSTLSHQPKVPKHKLTEGVGYFLIGVYHVVAVIVLLNMLIAMMANTFKRIQSDSDCEWKFERTVLRMTYYSEVWYLPPPFNVLILGWIMRNVAKLCANCSNLCNSIHRHGTSSKKKQNKEYVYKHLMEKLYKRYWNKKKEQNGQDFSSIYDNLAQLNTNHSKE